MKALIFVIAAVWFSYLSLEAFRADRARKKLLHVVHVNGTRGKSSVSRMIEAGLRAGGFQVFCKTTGTVPMTIDVNGKEEPIRRRGKANIREQIKIMERAADQGAEILICECMALNPEYQAAAQHKILKADIGVITNARRDHMDIMGETLPEICDCLCSMVPEKGILFTAEQDDSLAAQMRERAEENGSRFMRALPDGTEPDFDFSENIALALAVCAELGVPQETALSGMKNFKRDPYALSFHRIGNGIFINGFSINDIQSIGMIWDGIKNRRDVSIGRFLLLVNNRADRGSRTKDMLETCRVLKPDEVWLMGASLPFMRRGLKKDGIPVREFRCAEAVPLKELGAGDVVFAVGNIANDGAALIDLVRKEGTDLV